MELVVGMAGRTMTADEVAGLLEITPAQASEFLAQCYARCLVDKVGEADVVIASTASPKFILTPKLMKGVVRTRRHRPLFIIDIAVPQTHPATESLNGLIDVAARWPDVDNWQSHCQTRVQFAGAHDSEHIIS